MMLLPDITLTTFQIPVTLFSDNDYPTGMKTYRVMVGETGPVLLAITKASIFIMFMSTMFTQ